MKRKTIIKPSHAMLAVLGVASAVAINATETNNLVEPIGWLQATPTQVQVGVKPNLTWGITYPNNLESSIDIQGPGTVIPQYDMLMECRVIGTGITHKSPYSGEIVYDIANIHIQTGNSGYSQIFYDSNPHVDPSKVIYSKIVKAGEPINYKGTYHVLEDPRERAWYTSDNESPNIHALLKGDVPPSKLPPHGSPSLEKFLAPYLDAEGKVNIGPMDAIYFMELTHGPGQTGNKGYDMQDFVMLVTFKKIESTTPPVVPTP